MKRHKPTGLDIANNPEYVLTEVNSHAMFTQVEKPNQTDPEYITYDIACNEDFALHAKYHNWKKIFQFFVDHPIAKATLATKVIPKEFLEFDPKGKVRIRFSLMPQRIADKLEPNTSSIKDRISAVNDFIKAGYEVHLNFSPIVVYAGWLADYKLLFEECDKLINDEFKKDVLAEAIFLTHNQNKHEKNLLEGLEGEDLLWRPDIQETKTSQYGGVNIRYRHEMKKLYIDMWQTLHDELIPWNKIRYIF
jgi:spore photoproduct lyase